jgi:hypothetical protein
LSLLFGILLHLRRQKRAQRLVDFTDVVQEPVNKPVLHVDRQEGGDAAL